MSDTPDGININKDCGSTHPEFISSFTRKVGADLGFSFDGDGDRLIACDHNGDIVDGDFIMYTVSKYLHSKGKLSNGTVVSTVMSNIGFYKAIETAGLKSVATKVGDRYVMEEMRTNNYNFGGEQSGHLIFLDYITTGDGLLSAIMVLNMITDLGVSLKDACSSIVSYPQLLKNIRVVDKESVLNDETINNKIDEVKIKLGNEGRVLVRPSGTEPLIRVMVEAKTIEICTDCVEEIACLIK